MLADASVCNRFLRRYATHSKCPVSGMGYHNAESFLDTVSTPRTPDGYVDGTKRWNDADARWPDTCLCGYEFRENDDRQLYIDDLWRRTDTKELFSLRSVTKFPSVPAPPGALWNARWLTDVWAGPDGKCWVLRLPDGTDWTIDGPSAQGKGWERTGIAPNLTVKPSILTSSYHGWLTDGVLKKV